MRTFVIFMMLINALAVLVNAVAIFFGKYPRIEIKTHQTDFLSMLVSALIFAWAAYLLMGWMLEGK